MRLGITAGSFGPKARLNMELIGEADRLGYYAAWTAEAWGNDAVTMATWILARTRNLRVGTGIMQIPARTPAMTAMTAMTLDHLSDGRFLVGLGLSGPQVVEGWHGVPYGRPLTRTREYVEILRRIWARQEPLTYDGKEYQIPYRGPRATGLGKPLKSILHGRQLPVYIAAISPRSVEQTAEIADGWLPIFYSPFREHVWKPHLEAGFARAGGGKSIRDFDVAASVAVVPGDDLAACLQMVKPMLALYIGGMGAREKNFYNDLACRYGFEAEARRVQDLYLSGKKQEATAAVPDQLADEVSLCGPWERIRDRLQAWKASCVTTLNVGSGDIGVVRKMAELAA